jgi:response regulator RpfG family c-di-GMP phosphodiesterase
MLESTGYRVMTAICGEDCLLRVKEEPPDVILLDVMMPGLDGFATTQLLKANEVTRLIPVVMVTALSDVKDRVRALDAGADDFLTKPVDKFELLARVKASLKVKSYQDEIQQQRLEKEELLNKTLKGSIRLLIEILAQTNPAGFSQCSRLVPLARRIARQLMQENAWQAEMVVMLAPIIDVAIPSKILAKVRNEEQLDPSEDSLFRIRNRQGARLLGDIPHLADISGALVYRYKNFDGTGLPDDMTCGNDIPMTARIAKAVFDYDKLLQLDPEADIIALMRSEGEKYDINVLAVLKDVVRFISMDALHLEVPVDELEPGMIISQDIVDVGGRLLVGRGNEVTPLLIMRLQQMSAAGTIKGSVKIFPGSSDLGAENESRCMA